MTVPGGPDASEPGPAPACFSSLVHLPQQRPRSAARYAADAPRPRRSLLAVARLCVHVLRSLRRRSLWQVVLGLLVHHTIAAMSALISTTSASTSMRPRPLSLSPATGPRPLQLASAGASPSGSISMGPPTPTPSSSTPRPASGAVSPTPDPGSGSPTRPRPHASRRQSSIAYFAPDSPALGRSHSLGGAPPRAPRRARPKTTLGFEGLAEQAQARADRGPLTLAEKCVSILISFQ
jgi:hypothetical protein